MDVKPTITGRDSQLELLLDYLSEAVSGDGSLILVSGEAGIGKTRLVEEFQKMASKINCAFLFGRCVPGTAVPFLPFHEAFENALKVFDEKEQISPENRLFAVLDCLKDMSGKQTTILVLEDIHWIDSTSAQLLHFLARNITDLRVLMIGTYRPEDLVSADAVSPLQENLRVMKREGICREINLQRLNNEETTRAITTMLGNSQENLLSKIATESGGNPLFMVEIVHMLLSSGAIVNEDGEWKEKSKGRMNIPVTINEVILRRLDGLNSKYRRIVDTASVVGEPFDPNILVNVLKVQKLELLESLDTISRTSKILQDQDGLICFSHDKIRSVTYQNITSQLRRELHHLIANAIESQPFGEEAYGKLSNHFYYSGETEKCIKNSVLAGEFCRKQYAQKEAIEFYQRVLELTKDDPRFREERFTALNGLGEMFYIYGSLETGHKYKLAALDLCTDPKMRAEILCDLSVDMGPANLGGGSTLESHKLLDEAEKCEKLNHCELGRIKEYRGDLAIYEGNFKKSELLLLEAEKILRSCGDNLRLGETLLILMDSYRLECRIDEAITKGEEAQEICAKIKIPDLCSSLTFKLGYLYGHKGLLDKALSLFPKALQSSKKLGDIERLAFGHYWRAWIYESESDFPNTMADAKEAHRNSKAQDPETPYLSGITSALLAHSELRIGMSAEGAEHIKESFGDAEVLSESGIKAEVFCLATCVKAELLSMNKDWSSSKKAFQIGVEMPFHSSPLVRARVRTWFAESILKFEGPLEAKKQFEIVSEIYRKMGNQRQIEKIKVLMDSNIS